MQTLVRSQTGEVNHRHAVTGVTNHSLRGLADGSLGTDYSTSQMTYDLRRLRSTASANMSLTPTYLLTLEGQCVTAFYTKLHRRVLGPQLDADRPSAPMALRRALAVLDKRSTTMSQTRGSKQRHETCHNVRDCAPG